MYFNNMFDPRSQPPRATPLRPSPPPPPKRPKQEAAKSPQKKRQQGRCPSGFRWDSKKGKCVQAGVGPEFRP